MKPLLIGYGKEKRPVTLTAADLETHVHGVGASRTGKSKLVEWIARELIRREQGFCLIDPHGFLYEDIVRWLAYLKPKREIVLFNPSFEERVVGFNPFARRGGGDVSTQVDRRVRATVKAWGVSSTDQTPRLERWLRCLYHVLMEQGYSIEVAQYLLSFEEKEVREYLIRSIEAGVIRREWEELSLQTRLPDFLGQVESTRNKVFRFITAQQIRRVVGLTHNNLDIEEIVEEGKILLVNLQPSAVLSEENARVIGTLLLNELWEVGKRRGRGPTGRPPPDFFIIVDEFQRFLTPDVPDMLDQGAKYGYHLFLLHQHLSQLEELDREAYGAVMTNARTKLVFGGLRRADAQTMVGEIFPGQLDLKRIKFLIEQTKFWPVYTRDTVSFRSSGSGSGSGQVEGMTWSPTHEEWVPSSTASESSFVSSQEGEADTPLFYPVPFREVSSIVPYSLEETVWEMADRLMEQYQRHFFVRRPGQKTVVAVTPYVKSWLVTPERVEAYTVKQLGGFLTSEEVDEALEEIHASLQREALPVGVEFNPDDVWEPEEA